jgi:stress-induced-phosphoprotein 1
MAADDDAGVRFILEEAMSFKNEGNKLFSSQNFHGAIEKYTCGLELVEKINSKDSHLQVVLHSNRSACYFHLQQFGDALSDATECVRLSSTFMKGHFRCGEAYMALGRVEDAVLSYQRAVALSADPVVREKLSIAKSAQTGGLYFKQVHYYF